MLTVPEGRPVREKKAVKFFFFNEEMTDTETFNVIEEKINEYYELRYFRVVHTCPPLIVNQVSSFCIGSEHRYKHDVRRFFSYGDMENIIRLFSDMAGQALPAYVVCDLLSIPTTELKQAQEKFDLPHVSKERFGEERPDTCTSIH